MENNTPLVSIVCDTYNQAPFISDALDGFLAQKTDFPFEIIVHDDASTDGTAEIILAYEREHPDLIRCICRTENIYSRDPKILEHYVFPHARGKYIAICEGDDFWTSPDKLQKQVSYLEAHPECTLCVCAGDLVDPEGNKTGSVAPYPTDRDVPTDELIRGGGGFVATASIVAPTSLAKNRAAFCDMSDVDDAVLQNLVCFQWRHALFCRVDVRLPAGGAGVLDGNVLFLAQRRPHPPSRRPDPRVGSV